MNTDEYWLGVASAIAAGAKCTRRQVGALLVRDGRIFSAGKNGTPPGEPNCTREELGCPRGCHALSRVNVKFKGHPDFCICGNFWPCPDSAQPNHGYGDSACVHAELNALLYAGREQTEHATVYCTDKPCHDCFKHIRAAGCDRVVTPDFEWNRTPTAA